MGREKVNQKDLRKIERETKIDLSVGDNDDKVYKWLNKAKDVKVEAHFSNTNKKKSEKYRNFNCSDLDFYLKKGNIILLNYIWARKHGYNYEIGGHYALVYGRNKRGYLMANAVRGRAISIISVKEMKQYLNPLISNGEEKGGEITIISRKDK